MELFGANIANQYEKLTARFGEACTATLVILSADDLGTTESAWDFAQGVRTVNSAWPTKWFVAEERRIQWPLAQLTDGEHVTRIS